jgi:hypothetical protein
MELQLYGMVHDQRQTHLDIWTAVFLVTTSTLVMDVMRPSKTFVTTNETAGRHNA